MTRGSASADADDLFDLLADGSQRDPERLERLRGEPFALADQAEQDVLGPDVVVIEEPRFFLREHDDPPSAISETFEHAKERRCQLTTKGASGRG